MANKKIIGVYVLIILVIFVAIFIALNNKAPTNNESKKISDGITNSSNGQPIINASTTILTMDDISKNNTANRCWTAINDSVYDLTDWISKHPGGEGAILYLCGKDGTKAFTSKHGTSEGPNNTLLKFKIGNLAK